ncbi:TetR family transcriptional regulator [Gordonia sp. VNQ95]|jgi:AcrR family transcriptional regulator|uniref:TetR family transcriptional regulator n=1 Tax=Gordonia sp. VNQ95 TaxID=3156619 RepID=UPI0032B43005
MSQPSDHSVGTDLDSVPLRRVPTQTRSREKVSRALVAADVIARRDGVEALTLTRVAEEAGLSVGALHQYLPDREAIAAALVARYHERIEAQMDAIIDRVEVGAVDDPVREVIGRIAQIYTEERSVRLVRAMGAVAADGGRAHKARMVDKLRELMVRCGMPGTDMAVVRIVFASADAVMHEAFAGDEPDATLLAELETMLRAYLDQR